MRSKIKYKIFIIVLAGIASACAKKREQAPAAEPTATSQPLVKVEKVESFQTALTLVATSTVACADSASCPSQVGLFLAADKAGGLDPGSDAVAACTASLVGENLVLTNSHCLPSAVKLLPDLCAERVRVVLPASGGQPEETLACEAVVGFSERATELSPDLALIRVKEKSKRKPLPISRAGVANGTALLSYKVDPEIKERRGTLRAETCVSAANSYRMPLYRNETSPTLVAGDCSAVAGNSGSPLLLPSGEVAALLQAELPLSEQARREWGGSAGTQFAPLALGTSLRCLAKDLPAWEWNEDCATITEQDVALAPRPRVRQMLGDTELKEKISALLAPFTAQAEGVRWEKKEIDTKALRRRETLAPACVAGEAAELELEVPRLSIEVVFNKYLQPLGAQASLAGSAKESVRLNTCAP